MAETTSSFDAAAYTGNGTARERVALPEDMFDGVVNKPVLHQAVKARTNRPGFRQRGTDRHAAVDLDRRLHAAVAAASPK